MCDAGGRFECKGRRRRTLPPGHPGSTIRAARLNDRVRDGNGCDPRAIVTDQFLDWLASQVMGSTEQTGHEPDLQGSWSMCVESVLFLKGED